jgi:hypothetical protein
MVLFIMFDFVVFTWLFLTSLWCVMSTPTVSPRTMGSLTETQFKIVTRRVIHWTKRLFVVLFSVSCMMGALAFSSWWTDGWSPLWNRTILFVFGLCTWATIRVYLWFSAESQLYRSLKSHVHRTASQQVNDADPLYQVEQYLAKIKESRVRLEQLLNSIR